MMTPNNQLQSWLAIQADVRGIIACCVGLANQTCVCGPASKSFEGQSMHLVMRCLSDAFDVAGLHKIPSAELRWTFDNAVIQCVRRPDRHFIALFLEPDERQIDTNRVRQVIEEFKIFSSIIA